MNLLRSEASEVSLVAPTQRFLEWIQEGEIPELQRHFYCRDRSLMELLL